LQSKPEFELKLTISGRESKNNFQNTSHLAALVNLVLAALLAVLLELKFLAAAGVQSGHVIPLFALCTF
jgi:hypothetical protein